MKNSNLSLSLNIINQIIELEIKRIKNILLSKKYSLEYKYALEYLSKGYMNLSLELDLLKRLVQKKCQILYQNTNNKIKNEVIY